MDWHANHGSVAGTAQHASMELVHIAHSASGTKMAAVRMLESVRYRPATLRHDVQEYHSDYPGTVWLAVTITPFVFKTNNMPQRERKPVRSVVSLPASMFTGSKWSSQES